MALNLLAKAPDFVLPSTSGNDFQLSVDAGGRPLILYFYPRDFTPGCTREACSFRDHFDAFRDLEIDVVGVSADPLKKHHEFIKRFELPFELLSDTSGKVSRLYKARMPVLNIPKRITYLIDSQHKIAAVYDNLFGAENHIKRMIKEVRSKT